MISIPFTSFSRANSTQAMIAAEELNEAPGVTEVNWSVFGTGKCFENQKAVVDTQEDQTKAMASSKQGQSSTGDGC